MYPYIYPYESGHMDTGEGHELYYELCGNPEGKPVVYVHGGPGAGSQPDMRRLFNPDIYKIIIFDQRGAGKSKPFASLENNTMQHLIDDLERLRNFLEIDKWLVTGWSFGTALSLLYTLQHKDKVAGLVLLGLSFADPEGVAWLTEEGGASELMPEWFAPYRDFIPEDKRVHGLAKAYYEIYRSGTDKEKLEATRRFTLWDMSLLYFDVPFDRIRDVEVNPESFMALARIFFHFVEHEYKPENKDRILKGVESLGDIPCHIIHGRHDLICPVARSYELYKAYPGSELHVFHGTGHTSREPVLARAVADITDGMAGHRRSFDSYIRIG